MLNKLVCSDEWYCLWFHFLWSIFFITSSGHRMGPLRSMCSHCCTLTCVALAAYILRQSPYLANAMALIVLVDALCTCTSEAAWFRTLSRQFFLLFCNDPSVGSFEMGVGFHHWVVPGHIFWFIRVDDRGVLNCFKMAKLYQLCVKQTEKHTNYDPLSQSLSPPSRLFRSFQARSGGMPEGFWMRDAINDDMSIYNDVNCLFVCIEFIAYVMFVCRYIQHAIWRQSTVGPIISLWSISSWPSVMGPITVHVLKNLFHIF